MRNLLPIGLALLLLGCVSLEVTRLQPLALTPIAPKNVAIYWDRAQIHGQCREIALISGEFPANTSEKLSHMYLQEKAGKLGANAIILDQQHEPSSGQKFAAGFGLASDTKRIRATAVYISPEISE